MSNNLAKVHWVKDALCKFDKKFVSFHIDDVIEAKSICAQCTVQVECIMANAEVDGTFTSAGLSKYDRLLIQWKRVSSKNEGNFRDSTAYVSEVVRRVRKTLSSRAASDGTLR
jgi:hypothetical protein